MKYKDLRDFIELLEKQGELKRTQYKADPYLEITEICDRTLKQEGPAILFEQPKNSSIPLLGNLFGTPHRVALGMGAESVSAPTNPTLADYMDYLHGCFGRSSLASGTIAVCRR